MALLWAESFDFYGTSIADLQLRGCVVSSNVTIGQNSSLARTGTGYIQMISGADRFIYRVLDTPVSAAGATLGSGVGMYVTALPVSGVATCMGIRFPASGGVKGLGCSINANLGFSVVSGTAVLGVSANNLFVLNSWFWLECKITINTGGANTGTIEVRYQGITVVTVNGIDIPGPLGYAELGGFGLTSNGSCRWDDWVIWDGTGAHNNDFLGDRRCVTSYPTADTALADWTPSTGTVGYQMIDEAVPSDADYIAGNAVGNISEFQKAPIGIASNDVAGVVMIARALKSDAGASDFRIGVHSGIFVTETANLLPGTSAAYFQGIFERDPNGDIQWTQASVDAATMRFNRTV